jgi:hypothetical protein
VMPLAAITASTISRTVIGPERGIEDLQDGFDALSCSSARRRTLAVASPTEWQSCR